MNNDEKASLSNEVKIFLSTFGREIRSEEDEKYEKMIDLIVDNVISTREVLLDNKLASIEKLISPELVAVFLDERFTRNAVDAVPGYVSRLMQLSRLEGTTIPSNITNGYMREAARTYIFGLPQATVALSRAALEQALKEKLGKQLSGEFITFQQLLKDARKWNILDGIMETCARDVANAGDDVMHDRPTDLPKALEVLDKLRGLFRHIYSVEGHY